jgi:hypothetical protein
MIISECREVHKENVAPYAWAGLRQFQNNMDLEAALVRIHSIPVRERSNAKKQASQIDLCISQAREYFNAAAAVTMTTRPVLLYYGLMHLALAEVLFKQDGSVSLDKARQQHRHHGLIFALDARPNPNDSLTLASGKLSAKPLEIDGHRYGTFELWHRSAREGPLCGSAKLIQANGASNISARVLLTGSDERLPLIPHTGISFQECLEQLPCMIHDLATLGLNSKVVRGLIKAELTQATNISKVTLIVHPCAQSFMDALQSRIEFEQRAIEHFALHEVDRGLIMVVTGDEDWKLRFSLPSGASWSSSEIRFMPTTQSLNEFGLFYIALFILGNYARYYPDYWIKDIAANSKLALSVERFLEYASERVPLLTLDELTQTAHIRAK